MNRNRLKELQDTLQQAQQQLQEAQTVLRVTQNQLSRLLGLPDGMEVRRFHPGPWGIYPLGTPSVNGRLAPYPGSQDLGPIMFSESVARNSLRRLPDLRIAWFPYSLYTAEVFNLDQEVFPDTPTET